MSGALAEPLTWPTEVFSREHQGAAIDSARARQARAAEYSVYSYLLRGTIGRIVNDSTTPAFQGRSVFCFEPDRKPGSCIQPDSGTSVETWKDFARKNKRSHLILPLFDKELGVILKRDAKLPEPSCDGPTITYFSGVGLNPDLDEAIVYTTIVTGKGPMPGCGFAQGDYLVLKKSESGWKPFGPQTMWVT
jgi:hypothetical protein